MQAWEDASRPATVVAVQVASHNRWGAFWKQQQRRWRQYDIISTACTMVLLTGNVLRSCGANSQHTAEHKQALGWVLHSCKANSTSTK